MFPFLIFSFDLRLLQYVLFLFFARVRVPFCSGGQVFFFVPRFWIHRTCVRCWRQLWTWCRPVTASPYRHPALRHGPTLFREGPTDIRVLVYWMGKKCQSWQAAAGIICKNRKSRRSGVVAKNLEGTENTSVDRWCSMLPEGCCKMQHRPSVCKPQPRRIFPFGPCERTQGRCFALVS